MGDVASDWVGVGIALVLGVGGCGGRVEQVNVGSEREPGGLAMMQGRGGETQSADPTAPGTASTPACSFTRRTDARFDDATGSFSPDGSLLALLGNTAAPLQVFRPQDDFVMSAFEHSRSQNYYRAAVSPDNSLVAAVGDGVTLFTVADGAVLADVPVDGQAPDNGQATALDFSHDGQLLATADGSNATANIWSVPDLGLVRSISVRPDQYKRAGSSIAFSPDDSRVATVTGNVVAMWNVADGSPVWSQAIPFCSQVGDVMFSPDGTQLVEACLDGPNGILSATTGRMSPALGTASHGVGSVSYFDDDRILIGDDGFGARIWTRDADGEWSPSCTLTSETPQWGQVTASQGGRRLYVHVNGGANAAWIYEQAP